MTVRAPRPCRKPGCGQLCRDGSGYCEGHKSLSIGWNQPGRAPRHKRYGPGWSKTRQRILRRDKHLCQPCQEKGLLTQAYAVDHITPKARGGDDSDDNLRSICRQCHAAKSAQEAAAGRRGGGSE